MIAVHHLSLRLGAFSLDDVTFTVPTGCYAVLMGATGSGKTSVIEALCGLRAISAGMLAVGGRDVTNARPGERSIGYVPQDGGLFPTMTVREHLAFAPRLRRWPNAEIAARTAELSARLGIAHLLDRRPLGLSGGERQRVALARALAFRPTVLCLDEPLSALDETTRDDLLPVLAGLKADGATVLHVTHSRREAAALADLLLVIDGGSVREQPVASLDVPAPSRP